MHVLHIYIIFFIFMLSCNESESETQAITESNCRASLTMPETTKSLLLSLEDDLINHYVNQIGRGVLLTGINSIDPLSKDDLNTVLLRIGTNISKSHDTTETQDLPYSEEYFLGCTSISNITFNIVEDNKFDMSSIINSFNESLKDTDIQSILPTPDKEATFLSQVIKSNIKGIILSGGDNIGDFPDRDQTEDQLIEYSLEKNIPILGVCRGMQILNRYFGGDIIKNGSNEHVRINHKVKISDLKFEKLFTKNEIEVNSFHRNIIPKEKLHDGFIVFAMDERDDTVEGYYHKKYPITGVMWHPERTYNERSFLLVNDVFRG